MGNGMNRVNLKSIQYSNLIECVNLTETQRFQGKPCIPIVCNRSIDLLILCDFNSHGECLLMGKMVSRGWDWGKSLAHPYKVFLIKGLLTWWMCKQTIPDQYMLWEPIYCHRLEVANSRLYIMSRVKCHSISILH